MIRKLLTKKFRQGSILNPLPAVVTMVVLSLLLLSCKKLVEIPPPITSITDTEVYSTDQTAVAILNGLYTSMVDSRGIGNNTFSGLGSIHISTGLSADELYLSSVGSTSEGLFFRNSLIDGLSTGSRSWEPLYNLIFRCNAALEGIDASTTLSSAIKPQLLGEAYFLRAYLYFYLVNQFGPVPLVTTTDYTANVLLPRSPIINVYKQITSDLIKAQALLSEQFLNGSANGTSSERTRPTKWAATAMLARVYLYTGDNANAAEQATLVLNNSKLFGMPTLNAAFLKTSNEAIWQLQPIIPNWNTEDAKIFVIPGNFSTSNPLYLNPSLVKSFENGDQRLVNGNWVNTVMVSGTQYKYAYKYKVNTANAAITPGSGTQNMTEFMMMLRLGEQYLIRAEARTRNGDLQGAINDIDSVRKRAGLPLISVTNPSIPQNSLLEAILHERQVELFTEGGHRWFDLKRTGKIDEVMGIETPLKGGSWESYKALFPISHTELIRAPNLVQNPGYPN